MASQGTFAALWQYAECSHWYNLWQTGGQIKHRIVHKARSTCTDWRRCCTNWQWLEKVLNAIFHSFSAQMCIKLGALPQNIWLYVFMYKQAWQTYALIRVVPRLKAQVGVGKSTWLWFSSIRFSLCISPSPFYSTKKNSSKAGVVEKAMDPCFSTSWTLWSTTFCLEGRSSCMAELYLEIDRLHNYIGNKGVCCWV